MLSDRDHDEDGGVAVLPGALLGGAAAQLHHIMQARVGGELKKNILLWLFHQVYAGRPKRWDTDPVQMARGMRVRLDPRQLLADLGYQYSAKGMVSDALKDLAVLGLIRYDGDKQTAWLLPYTQWPKQESADRDEQGKAEGRTAAAAAERASRPNAGAPKAAYRPEPGTTLGDLPGYDKWGTPWLTHTKIAEELDSPLHPVSAALIEEAWRFVQWWHENTKETIHIERGDLHELCGWLVEDGFTARELAQRFGAALTKAKPRPAHAWPYLRTCMTHPRDGWQRAKAQQRAARLEAMTTTTTTTPQEEAHHHGGVPTRDRRGAGAYQRATRPAHATSAAINGSVNTLNDASERGLRELLAAADAADALDRSGTHLAGPTPAHATAPTATAASGAARPVGQQRDDAAD